MSILAIDPGPEESGWCVWESARVTCCAQGSNLKLLALIQVATFDQLAIEMVAGMGLTVGQSVFETCRWIGRFQQGWRDPEAVLLIPRHRIKLHLCGSMQAKDKNIRQRLIDLIGPQGVKRAPGPTYGVSGHGWSALAVAATAAGLV